MASLTFTGTPSLRTRPAAPLAMRSGRSVAGVPPEAPVVGVLVDPSSYFEIEQASAPQSSRSGVRGSAQRSSAQHPSPRESSPMHPAVRSQRAPAPSPVRSGEEMRSATGPVPSARSMRVRLVAIWSAVAALVIAGASVAAATTPQRAAPRERVWIVAEGDSLWSIARAIQPTGDVRPMVRSLLEFNGNAALRAGDRVVLPDAPR
jgi:hypothetical protein